VSFKRLGIDEAAKVYEVASSEEKALLRKMFTHKIQNSTKSAEEKTTYRAMVE